jgi:hypothetical protein
MGRKPPIPLTLNELEQAKALSALGKTYHAIGQHLERDPKTIKSALTKSPVVIREINAIKEDLAAMFEDTAKRMIASITDEDIEKINAYQRTVAAGISTDKMRLLRGESTERIDAFVLTADLAKLRQERERLERIVAGRKVGNGIKSMPDDGNEHE